MVTQGSELLFVFYLFLAVLGLHCCIGFPIVVASWGCSLAAVHSHCGGFSCGTQALGSRASVVAAYGLNSCGMQAQGTGASVVVVCRLGSCSCRALLVVALGLVAPQHMESSWPRD